MKLIAFKDGSKYFRILKNREFQICDLSKATVLPMNQLEEAIQIIQEIRTNHPSAKLIQMTITESPLIIPEENS